MSLYHFSVTQKSRGAGQSVVASAAYISGTKLHDNYYGENPDYTKKSGVLHSEIILPDYVPKRFYDREILWNEVENVEKHPKAQLAYSFDIALQNELSFEENLSLARQFILDNFTSRGMIVDMALHEPDVEEGGISNPHFHVLCPIRPVNPDGTWGAKQHREYILDEAGNRIKDEKAGLFLMLFRQLTGVLLTHFFFGVRTGPDLLMTLLHAKGYLLKLIIVLMHHRGSLYFLQYTRALP